MVLHLVARAGGLSGVMLIQGASRAVVLSDIGTAEIGRAGELREAFARRDTNDRDPSKAARPAFILAGRKFFVAAELLTVGCGELPMALLAAG
jgi:hypothetical protein